jgi:predicted small secreted protein
MAAGCYAGKGHCFTARNGIPEGLFQGDTTMKRAIALGFALLMTAGALAGCNTMEGAGQDVERGGQHVQDAAQ